MSLALTEAILRVRVRSTIRVTSLELDRRKGVDGERGQGQQGPREAVPGCFGVGHEFPIDVPDLSSTF